MILRRNFKKKHSERIVKLTGHKGSIIITDTWTIHRTAMLKSKNFRRKSLFFQIDNDLMHLEKIVINPEFLPQVMTPEMLQFLGFGLPSGYKTMPDSGLNTLNAQDLSGLILRSFFS